MFLMLFSKRCFAQQYHICEGYLYFGADSSSGKKILNREYRDGLLVNEYCRFFLTPANILVDNGFDETHHYSYKHDLLSERWEEGIRRNQRTIFFYKEYDTSQLVRTTTYTYDKQLQKEQWAWDTTQEDVFYEYLNGKITAKHMHHTAYPIEKRHRTSWFYEYDDLGRKRKEVRVRYHTYRLDNENDSTVSTYKYFPQMNTIQEGGEDDCSSVDTSFLDGRGNVLVNKHLVGTDGSWDEYSYIVTNSYDKNDRLMRSVARGVGSRKDKVATIVYYYK